MYQTERTELLKHISVQWYNKKGESPKPFQGFLNSLFFSSQGSLPCEPWAMEFNRLAVNQKLHAHLSTDKM